MTDAQIATLAISFVVPISTLLAGIFFQDGKLQQIYKSLEKIESKLDKIQERLPK
jgi:hypothetical protein